MKNTIKYPYSDASDNLKPSFIRQILKTTQSPDIISFAGGLPNPITFPIKEMQAAANVIFESEGPQALQYTVTAGFPLLRQLISKRYQSTVNLKIDPDNILITTGSQQAIDLIAKLIINPGDEIIIENPCYLGALQAFSLYRPRLLPIPLENDGINLNILENILKKNHPKLMYCVPTSHNPTGTSYSLEKRSVVAQLLQKYQTLLIEDDPYNELNFDSTHFPPIKTFLYDRTFILGSFSKSISPGLRVGWVSAIKPLINRLVQIKEATDLHTDHLSQRLITQYLFDNNFDQHLNKIRQLYLRQAARMYKMVKNSFPQGTEVSMPQGGMFLWTKLPKGISATNIFEKGLMRKVAFVPGKYFFTPDTDDSYLRLNFSNTNLQLITKGIKILAEVINDK